MKAKIHFKLLILLLTVSCACSKYPSKIAELELRQAELQRQYEEIVLKDSIEKAPAISVTFNTMDICLEAGASSTVRYHITNGGANPLVRVFSIDGWKTELVEEGPSDGYFVCTAPQTPCDGSATVLVSDGIRRTSVYTLSFSAADFMTISENCLYVPAEGGEKTLDLRTNVEYELSCSAGWIKAAGTKAVREEALTFKVEPNPAAAPRKASNTLKGNGITTDLAVFQSGRRPERDDKLLPILAWYSIPDNYISVERYAEMEECGFNISFSTFTDHESVKESLDMAAQTGVRLQVCWSGLEHEAEQCAAELKDHPALWGYHIVDEPGPAAFDGLAKLTRRLETADPAHPSYINLLPDYAGQGALGGTFRQYVHNYMETVHPPLLSFDFYSIRFNEIVPSWWSNLLICYEEAEAAGVDMWAFVLSTAHDPYPISTPEMLRLYAYTDLVFGAQGIQYFTYWCPGQETWNFFHEAPITMDGRRTATYDMVKELNRELQNRAYIFLGADFAWMRSVGGTIQGVSALSSAEYPSGISSISANGRMASSLFTNEGHEYIAFVNCTYQETRTLDITLTCAAEVIDAEGRAQSVPAGHNTFVVGKGDILILRLK
ncbi:MAG: BACON domain-containing protein [Bacteroidales bacterium]|nr:BACON domain-containing protein [Candidatus Equibacterium intestinale]